MTPLKYRFRPSVAHRPGWWLLLASFILTLAVYWSGLYGGFLFDDYPNIVENHGVQPPNAHFSSLVGAALSSPSSEFKRPLASLSFATNYLISGLDPYWMKLTNLVLHLLNGMLVFLLARALLHTAGSPSLTPSPNMESDGPVKRAGVVAALIAASWMLLPINLTGVLYVVQRMESMANLFVLLGLIGYVVGRRRMLSLANNHATNEGIGYSGNRGFALCIVSITIPAAVGMLAKETAVLLPLYALLIEWTLFHFARFRAPPPNVRERYPVDLRIIGMYVLVLLLPMTLGLAWVVPGLMRPETWATRDFTLGTRLLSESRIVVDYIRWTVLPTPNALSFYHDDFRISTGLLAPWTTLASIALLGTLVALMLWTRRRLPLVALGIGLFLGCQLLTGTILPLELIYEHRNYFASFGLLLAIVPLLAAPSSDDAEATTLLTTEPQHSESAVEAHQETITTQGARFITLPMALPRYVLLGGLLLCWAVLTAMTAYAWGSPLRLARDLGSRAPESPRAQYELGRTYVIYSHYDAASPYTKLAYAPLERAAALPDASILPEQALIFMNARMHLPLKNAWWDSMITKLTTHKPGIQDESSLSALTECARTNVCDLPKDRMISAFMAALAHRDPSPRLLATYGDYAWNVLDDHALGLRMIKEAVATAPHEPAYYITEIRMLSVSGQRHEAQIALDKLEKLNIGGRLDDSIQELKETLGAM